MRTISVVVGLVAVAAACSKAERTVEPEDLSANPDVRVEAGIQYKAETAILESFPVQLATTVKLTNKGNSRRKVTFPDGCVVLIRAYRNAERTGEPAWDQSRVVACTMALVEVDLAPGESREYQARTDAGLILGDSLPNGRYYFTALLRPDGRALEIPAGDAELAVGR
jgi:hypothetical protein